MPTYEYHCSKCDTTFEHFQKMSDAPLTECLDVACGGKGTVKRLIGGGSGLIFKGSGFYITDYKNGNGNSAKSESGEAKSECKAQSKNEGASKGEGCPCASGGSNDSQN